MGAVEVLSAADALFQACSLPAISSPLEALFAQYRQRKEAIQRIAAYVRGESEVMFHFEMGARQRGYSTVTMGALFDESAAITALDCQFWDQALNLTDVLDYMPAKMRNEWSAMIRQGYVEVEKRVGEGWHSRTVKEKQPIPAFEAESVRATLQQMLLDRAHMFALRIEGLWDALSREHLTNAPQAFGKRMILKTVIGSCGHANSDMVSYIHDLRVVLAKFMGRDAPEHFLTSTALDDMAKSVMNSDGSGKWHWFDGGAWKVRCYKVGTAHMEIHPDMAWRLNAVLASLHPSAIPSEFRVKPKKAPKATAPLVNNLVPFEVLGELARARVDRNTGQSLSYWESGRPLSEAARDVLKYLGGVRTGDRLESWSFDYRVKPVLDFVLQSGQIPEQRAHQFYQTPSELAEELVAWADIGPDDHCCEPEAGLGAIAEKLPKERTICVEVSALHAKVLEAKGFATVCADFLGWDPGRKFDRIVMNPPFTKGQAETHLAHAASLLKDTGVLTAVLPSGLRGKTLVEGWKHEYSKVRDNLFKGTSVSVVLLRLSM